LYNEREGYTGKLERYIAGDIEDKLIEKIIYLKDNKIISEKEKPFNDILFKLITNNSNKSLNIDDASSNTNKEKSNFVSQILQPADDLKSKIQKFEAIKNNSFKSNPAFPIYNKNQNELIKENENNQNINDQKNNIKNSPIISIPIKTEINKVNIENKEIPDKINDTNPENDAAKLITPTTEDNTLIKETVSNNSSINVMPRDNFESSIFLLPIIVGIILLVNGIFLVSSFFFLPNKIEGISEAAGLIISYLSIFPGFFIPLNSLRGLSFTMLGLFLCFVGFDILLLGFSIWKNVKLSDFIGSIVFTLSGLLSLTSLLINGLSFVPFSIVSLVLNAITAYLLFKRTRRNQ